MALAAEASYKCQAAGRSACQRVEDNAFHLYRLSTDSVNSVQHLMQLEGIDHVAMGVRDIERSAKWYIDVLGFERLHEGMWNGVPTFIGKGNTGIALFPANQEPKTSAHREIRMLHLAFRADRENFLAAQQRTKEARNQIRIPGSRNRALDLFPRSRRPPARDYDVRGRVARRIRSVSLSQRKKHKNCRGRVSVIPSAVEESLANFSDNACVSNFERCLDFARHDKERRLRPAFGIERRIGRINR